MASITATEARRRLFALLDEVAESREPIQIAGKRHSAVLVSEVSVLSADQHPAPTGLSGYG